MSVRGNGPARCNAVLVSDALGGSSRSGTSTYTARAASRPVAPEPLSLADRNTSFKPVRRTRVWCGSSPSGISTHRTRAASRPDWHPTSLGNPQHAEEATYQWHPRAQRPVAPRRRRARTDSGRGLLSHPAAAQRLRFAERLTGGDRVDARFRITAQCRAADRALPDEPYQRGLRPA